MKHLRYWVAAICVWFFFLYNVERLGHPINIASFVYPFTLICAVAIILLPRLHHIPVYWLFLPTLPVFFLLKVGLGYQIGGRNLPITVTEICAIALSVILSSQIAWRLESLREAVSMLTTAHLEKGTYPFSVGQGRIYREIRRARRYQRPASLLAISATCESMEASVNRFIQEAQREIIQKYIAARVAHLLVEELQDSDVITQLNDHFVTLLPETGRETVAEVVKRLETAAQEKLGLKFQIGVSTFPDEAVTFESLLEQAETKMRAAAPTSFSQEEFKHSKTESIYRSEVVNL